MKLPSKKSSSILLLFIFVFQITISGCSKELKIEWSCIQSSKNSMQCDIINKGEVYMGSPAFEAGKYRKAFIHFRNLDTLVKRVDKIENSI